MDQDRGRGRSGGRGSRGQRDEEDDSFSGQDDEGSGGYDEQEDEPAERGRRGARPAPSPRGRPGAGRKQPAAKKSGWSLFGSSKATPQAGRRGGRVDFGSLDQDDEAPRYREEPDEDFEDRDRPARRPRPGKSRGGRHERLTLMDLATPVFGYAAILPQDAGGIHAGYQQLRDSVLAALQRMESEAVEHGIDPEDARDARYGLALFMDEQVADSEWSGRTQWVSEPLGLVVANDPEGGVNFFTRLDSFGERRKAVKEIFLVCLALGFRGTYIQLDPTQQAARLGEIRQKVVRSIHPTPLDSRDVLFPEAYTPAVPLEQEAPPPPRWWMIASFGIVAFCVLVYALLFWSAGSAGVTASAQVKRAMEGSR